jgi:hypothetical protein
MDSQRRSFRIRYAHLAQLLSISGPNNESPKPWRLRSAPPKAWSQQVAKRPYRRQVSLRFRRGARHLLFCQMTPIRNNAIGATFRNLSDAEVVRERAGFGVLPKRHRRGPVDCESSFAYVVGGIMRHLSTRGWKVYGGRRQAAVRIHQNCRVVQSTCCYWKMSFEMSSEFALKRTSNECFPLTESICGLDEPAGFSRFLTHRYFYAT